MANECRYMTTFVMFYGTYTTTVMSFRLMNAPISFVRMMDPVMKELPFVRVYLDDAVIFSKSLGENLEPFSAVLKRISGLKLKVKPSKCFFVQSEIKLLAHIVGASGVRFDPDKITAIQVTSTPSTKTDFRASLGLTDYYRCFMK